MKPNVIVRSYQRPLLSSQYTFKILKDQKDIDFSDKVYLVLANKEEYESYKPYLAEYPFKDIIYSGVGGNKAINAAIDYFPEGEPLVFMDGDLKQLMNYTNVKDRETKTKTQNLGELFEYSFQKMNETELGATIAYNFSNRVFQEKQPFFEFKPRALGGVWWGALNSDFLKTEQSHDDDNIRTGKILSKYGGTYSMNWFEAFTQVGINIGGMQTSGDRGGNGIRFQ